MGVNPSGALILDQSGQSVIEFLLMLPMMLTLALILIRVNTAIQVGIVNQQYARAQALWLTYNSPVYPYLSLREAELTAKSYNQMVIGVAENASPSEPGERYIPKAPTKNVTRRRAPAQDETGQEPAERALVRVRNTVTLCTQANVVRNGSGDAAILPLSGPPYGPDSKATALYRLDEASQFQICGGPLQYE